MANPYIAVGVAQGLEDARRRFRAEGQDDEDRAERKSELEYLRKRRGVVDARQDEQYGYETGLRPLRERAMTAQVRGAELGTEAAETQLNYAREDRPSQVQLRDSNVRGAELGVEGAELNLEKGRLGLERDQFEFGEAKTASGRESELHQIKMKQVGQQLEDEGMRRFLDALEGGADPSYAEKLFNAQGKNGIRPGSTQYDRKTGQVSFAGTGGKQFNGNISQLRALLPKAQGGKPMVVGAGGSVYDPNSGTFKRAPNAGGRSALGPNGQKLSPFNPQTHGEQTRRLVVASLGGEWDNNLQKFKIPPGQGEKIAYAASLADQVIRNTSDEGMQLGPGEVNDIVVNVMREVRTTGEAEKAARTEFKDQNVGEDVIKQRALELVEDSKIRAAQNLAQELEMMRSHVQQQQNSQSWPEPPETSEDMEGGEGMETPPVEMLREGYVQQFQDGSKWTLQNGRATRVE
jgi:hypothetical protein